MNRARVAALLRALADELEDEGTEETPPPRRARRLPVRPAGEVDEMTRARARSILREKGFRDA